LIGLAPGSNDDTRSNRGEELDAGGLRHGLETLYLDDVVSPAAGGGE